MSKAQFHIKAHYYLAMLIAFCLPIATLTPLFIMLILLNWLVEGDFKTKFKTIYKNKFALLFMAFYAIHLMGLLYTQNLGSGFFDIQVKFSLLIFPMIIASRPYNKDQRKTIFFSFINGCIFSSVLMLSKAIYTYEVSGQSNFFYSAFAYFLHPSYLSMYFNVAITWLLIDLTKPITGKPKFSKAFSIVTILFLTCIIFLLSSKLGIITMVLLYVGFIIYYIMSRKKYALGIAGILLIAVSTYSIIRFVPAINARVNNTIKALSKPSNDPTEIESTAVRVLVWKAANQVISENFLFGTGTGDPKDVLVKEYEKRGMTGALEHKLNTHNEFYQVFVSLGLVGFIILLANLLLPLGYAFKTKNTIYLLFLIITILNFLPESMFETQAGVMFYAFFNSLFCFNKLDTPST